MKKKWIILIVIIIVAAAAVYIYLTKNKTEQKLSFVTAKAAYGYIAKSVTATGNTQPVDTVSVGAQVSGVVKYVYADFNDEVKQGQLLAKVDPSIILAQTEQAKATLSNAKSNLEYQQNNFDRQSQLYNLGAISKADYQLALNQLNSAKASEKNTAAQVQLAERNLYYTNIYSPINGVVLNRNISAGQTIASSFNAPTLFVIAKDLTKMQVRASVDEADIGGVKKNQSANFTVDAFPEDVFNGTVEDILLHPAVSANVVTYTTLINVDNNEMKLKPGMTASININVLEDSNALLIPVKAINFKPDSSVLKNYVLIRADKDHKQNTGGGMHKTDSLKGVANSLETFAKHSVWIKKGDTLTEKRIITGLTDDSNIKVIKGLLPGDEVITGITKEAANLASTDQHSPFMPQMRRRPAAGTGSNRNQ